MKNLHFFIELILNNELKIKLSIPSFWILYITRFIHLFWTEITICRKAIEANFSDSLRGE